MHVTSWCYVVNVNIITACAVRSDIYEELVVPLLLVNMIQADQAQLGIVFLYACLIDSCIQERACPSL